MQHVRDLINRSQIREPIRKRLRGDHHLDPFLLEEGGNEKQSDELDSRLFCFHG